MSLANRLRAPLGRLESDARILAVAKLANVGFAMIWGFAVTFVFVRILPIGEFKAFLLLVAFANFTVSADFGFSGIIYARLRRSRVGEEVAAHEFRPEEVAMLFAFMAAVVLIGGIGIAACLATGRITTQHPSLFMAFYALCATNIFGLLVKRALAALDHNLLWEAIDAVRRGLSIILLLVALAGVPILMSVALQILLAIIGLGIGLTIIHREIGMAAAQWVPRRRGRGTLRPYLDDMRSTMLLTLSDVAAYNAPYFGIAAATHDPRPLLVFDFIFKMSRALSAVIRALVEASLPRLTQAWHQGRSVAVASGIARLRLMALGCAAVLALVLLGAGPALSKQLFDGHAVLERSELCLMALLLAGLAIMCVSTYVHNGFGRFGSLLPPSFVFLAGSILSVPVGMGLSAHLGLTFAMAFLACYAAVHVLIGLRHDVMLRRLARP